MRVKENTFEKGMMTVEAVLSLVPFILAILGIISFINIFMVHNKIQYAIYQAGSELAAYTYLSEALGIQRGIEAVENDVETETAELNDAVDEVTEFLGQLELLQNDAANGDIDNAIEDGEAAIEQGQEAVGAVGDLVRDPQVLLQNIVFAGIDEGMTAIKNWLLEGGASILVNVYLDQSFSESNAISADEYLEWMGVENGMEGLDFSNSNLFADGSKMIDIVVEYDLEIHFLKLFLEDPTVHVVQRSAVPAWLDGDGVHYDG